MKRAAGTRGPGVFRRRYTLACQAHCRLIAGVTLRTTACRISRLKGVCVIIPPACGWSFSNARPPGFLRLSEMKAKPNYGKGCRKCH